MRHITWYEFTSLWNRRVSMVHCMPISSSRNSIWMEYAWWSYNLLSVTELVLMVSLYLYSNIVIEYVVRLPASKSLGYWWNVGRILGLSITLQIITGRVLSCYYVSSGYMAYESHRCWGSSVIQIICCVLWKYWS